MKKINFVLFLCLLACTALAQSPHMINYQGVAVNNGGLAIANQTISIRATVHQDNPNGTVLYSEQQTASTDAGGLFNLLIGGTAATAITGSWAAIDWETSAKFLQIEMDPAGGASFVNMGTQQLVSVPYAEYSNKAGALIPTATITPNQITPAGASVDQVLRYDGTNWIAGNDGLTLPYSGIDPSPYSFKVYNTNAANSVAIYANTSGSGNLTYAMYGTSAGANAIGVHGRASGSGGIGVEGYTNNVTGRAIKGTHTSNGIAIEGKTVNGIGIRGECTSGAGTAVYGLSSGATGLGVYGESTTGIGVKGYGNNAGSTGVFGSSLSGTGILAVSFTGNALEVNGKLKIAGGNTNPSQGAVLTSDATGNATWKANRVAFEAVEDGFNAPNIPANTFTTLPLQIEVLDAGSNFNPSSAVQDPNTFIAPVAGVYQFNAYTGFFILGAYNMGSCRMDIYKNGNSIANTESGAPYNTVSTSETHLSINRTIHLNAGDKIKIGIYQTNGNNSSVAYSEASFSGHLIFAD